MPRPAPLVLTTVAALLSAGCGADRLETPDVSRPFTTGGTAERAFPQAGVTFQAPADWRFVPGQAPLVASTSSGSATVAVWRYQRAEPLPREDAALDEARTRLEEAARTRDRTFRTESGQRVKVDGAPGVELVGSGRINGRDRRIRSTHVYAKGAEFVIDQYAAPRDFALMDRAVFGPLVRSLKIDPPRS